MASFASPIPLVGRDRELGVLRRHLDAARTGHGSLVLIGGEAGIGKTALADALCREAAAQGVLVLVGRCYDLMETPPYGPWAELFGQYRRSDDGPLLPDVFSRRGTVGAVSSEAALLQQVLDFFSDLAPRQPVLLLLDDLHWADTASLDLLRFVARSCSAIPLLLVATYRVDELTRRHPLYQLLPFLVREAGGERMALHALDRDAVQRLVDEQYHLPEADADRLVVYLHTRAEGNPLFLGELLRSLEETRGLAERAGNWTLGPLSAVLVPPLLRQVIDARLAHLGDEARAPLAVAAVIGQDVSLAVWSTVATVDEEALVAVMERAIDAHIVSATDSGMRFVHALIREALYEGVVPVRRRWWHRRVGEALAAARSPDPDAVAYHFQRADDERALPWLLQAGERAQAAYAWTTAAVRFVAALALMEQTGSEPAARGWLLLRLSRLLRLVEVTKARAYADDAHTLAVLVGDRALAACAQFQRGLHSCLAGDVAHGLPEMETGVANLAALSDTERGHVARHLEVGIPDGWGQVVTWRANIGQFREARALGEHLIADAAARGDAEWETIRTGLIGLGIAYAGLGKPNEAASQFARARKSFLRTSDHYFASVASRRELELVALPYRTGDVAMRRQLADWAETEWEKASGAVSAVFLPRFMRLSQLVVEGQWAEAERLATAGSTAERGNENTRTMALQYVAILARLRGDAERAWRAVDEVLPAGSATEPGTVARFNIAVTVQQVAAALALDVGDLVTTKTWLDAHERWLEWSGAVLWRSEACKLWGHYYRCIGDTDRAYEHAERALTWAGDLCQPLAQIAAHCLLGGLNRETGRHANAAGHLTTALTLAEACEAPYERALVLLAQAELHVAEKRQSEAAHALAAARTIFAALDAWPMLAQVDAVAAQWSVSPPARSASPLGLTMRETEVLRLVARGLTNAQAAECLFVTPRTVNSHLTAIYAKLGVENRAAAIRIALDHGLR